MADPCLGRIVLGVGNRDRGDDAVGRLVVLLLRGRVPVDVRLIEQEGEATSMVAAFEGVQQAWVIDAAQGNGVVGTIHRIDCATDAVLPSGTVSSHGLGLAQAIGLARVLGTLPPHCIVYAIEAGDFTAGAVLSSAVSHAAHEVAEEILAELATPPPPSAHCQPHPAPATDHR